MTTLSEKLKAEGRCHGCGRRTFVNMATLKPFAYCPLCRVALKNTPGRNRQLKSKASA